MYILKLWIALFCLIFIQIATEAASRTCPTAALPCDDGGCVRRGKWCDGERNCQDGSDEAYCRKKSFWNKNPNNCTDAQFKCEEIGHCIPLVGQCDGFYDCMDNSDEWNCEPDTYDNFEDYMLSKSTSVVPTETIIDYSTESDEIEKNHIETTTQSFPSTTTPNVLHFTDQATSQATIKSTISSKSLTAPSSTFLPQTKRPYQPGFHNGHNHVTSRYHPTSSYFSEYHPIIQQAYDSRQQPYDTRQQIYDSRQPYDYIQQIYDTRQPYNSRQHIYDSRQQIYNSRHLNDFRQQDYGTRLQLYDNRQQLYNSIQPYETGQHHYDSRQLPYTSRQQLYDSIQHPYDTSQHPYDTSQHHYDTSQHPYDTSQLLQGPRRNRNQYPYQRSRMNSIRSHPTIQVRL